MQHKPLNIGEFRQAQPDHSFRNSGQLSSLSLRKFKKTQPFVLAGWVCVSTTMFAVCRTGNCIPLNGIQANSAWPSLRGEV